MNVQDEAWAAADAMTPNGMFSPAVERRFPSRWRAWYRSPDGLTSIGAWGDTQAAALISLANLVTCSQRDPNGAPEPGLALACTLRAEHEGDHITHGADDDEYGRWPA